MSIEAARPREILHSASVAITMHPEHANAYADDRKWLETRPAPPSGDMCPKGVRGMPGCAINEGDYVGIHRGGKDGAIIAYARALQVCQVLDAAPTDFPEHDQNYFVVDGDSLVLWCFDVDDLPLRWRAVTSPHLDDQLPLGDFTPSIWVWFLSEPTALDYQVLCKGRPGVWRITPDMPSISVFDNARRDGSSGTA